jgi:hypothetical protein
MELRQCSPRTGVTLSPGSSVYARSMPIWREPAGAPRRRRSPVRNASELLVSHGLVTAWLGAGPQPGRGGSQSVLPERAGVAGERWRQAQAECRHARHTHLRCSPTCPRLAARQAAWPACSRR